MTFFAHSHVHFLPSRGHADSLDYFGHSEDLEPNDKQIMQ